MSRKKKITPQSDYYRFVFDRYDKLILGYTVEMMEDDRYQLSTRRSKTYKGQKRRLWQNQNGICYWCKRQCVLEGDGGTPNEFTVDHIIALSYGGTNHWRNMVGSCHKCNNHRANVWNMKYKLVELDKPSEPIFWNEWLTADTIFEHGLLYSM